MTGFRCVRHRGLPYLFELISERFEYSVRGQTPQMQGGVLVTASTEQVWGNDHLVIEPKDGVVEVRRVQTHPTPGGIGQRTEHGQGVAYPARKRAVHLFQRVTLGDVITVRIGET
ncbi:hypothetical protein [Nocardia blacklockiae]|uniref:hypothetical protein n=1 Tax=Nocardia blacklockiae TaxID=480036 RepID=UPI001E602F77|nr:hypothetical protein [Nocardia blacklockiae]